MKYGFLEKANFLMTNKIYNLFIKDLFAIKGRASRKEFLARFLMMIILCITGRYFFDVFHSNEDSVLGRISGLAASFILTPILIIYVIKCSITQRRFLIFIILISYLFQAIKLTLMVPLIWY